METKPQGHSWFSTLQTEVSEYFFIFENQSWLSGF
jgi:hypothetical protein